MRIGRSVVVHGSLAAFVMIGCGGGAEGYHPEQLACVPDSPCADAVCVHGVCREEDGQPVCECDTGYQDNDQDGSCNPTCAFAGLSCPEGEICSDASGLSICVSGTRPTLYISFHWHMHQPIYWPYESVVDTEANNRMGYSVYTIHHDRGGPYGSWPRDAVDAGRHLPHLGAQVSLSGSLMENLNGMTAAGAWPAGWQAPWSTTTSRLRTARAIRADRL